MSGLRAADLFNVRGRFLRSAHLERDWNDPATLQGYVLTPHTRENLTRLASGLSPNSGSRAWRITGDYGSGKSSFALLMAHLFSERETELPPALRGALDRRRIRHRPNLLPVLITGSREPMGKALLRALNLALLSVTGRGRTPKVLKDVQAALHSDDTTDAQILSLIKEANTFVIESGKADGLLLILDEMGKFLEYAAMHPDRQDIYLLQGLAEAAARSGPSPLFVVGLLHQGFSAYADGLSHTGQKEWEKVAGRYEELIWNQPVEQVAELVANALNVRQILIAPTLRKTAERDMREALRLRWYGVSSAQSALRDVAAQLFPLHPTVLPPLVRLFSRFGQNERSLFNFLLGNEPFGLQDFTFRTGGREFFRLCDLFDYTRATFGYRLSVQSYRSHWNAIDAIIASYPGQDSLELQVLKTVGLLNVLDAGDLLASKDVIALALHGCDHAEAALRRLKDKQLLHFRGVAGGYSLWPHTSISLERAHEDAGRALGPVRGVAPLITNRLENRPLVARRHYIESGNLRHFDVVYCTVESLPAQLNMPSSADGRILVPLCETPDEESKALAFARSTALAQRPEVLIAVPHPLQGLAGVVDELRRWEWIERNVPELKDDGYALEEVLRQLSAARQVLGDQLNNAIGLTNPNGDTGLRWFYTGQERNHIHNSRDVMTMLSVICEKVYRKSPHIHNELINRRSLSSAAAAARMRLIERLFESPTRAYLGMDAGKKPPEMSMYLSVLQAAGLHRPAGAGWTVALPDEDFDKTNGRVLPALRRIHDVLSESVDDRVPITQIFEKLREAPYGVRDGLSPLLLAVFAVVYEQELAFYEDGNFQPRMTGSVFLRLTKAPETFELQFCPITGVRSELFRRLMTTLNLGVENVGRVDILDVVKPLLTFAAGLPPYTLKTSRLSRQTQAVREALTSAREPATLLFHDLPLACGLPAFRGDAPLWDDQVEKFAEALKASVDELRGAYAVLLKWIQVKLQGELTATASFEAMQRALLPRASSLVGFITEPRLKSFCLRITDANLSETQWLESLGSLVCSMPPVKWRDTEVHKYEQEIHNLCIQFARVEAVAFKHQANRGAEAVRVALTKSNGEERDRVVYLSPEDRDQASQIELEMTGLLRQHGSVGVAAATQALWRVLEGGDADDD